MRPGDRRKEENRLLLKEWFAQKREIPDIAGMSHVSTVLRRIVDDEDSDTTDSTRVTV